ncbi:MAG: NAD(P) transhydrogenase subunit alpha [Holosporaceae bacterium]|nr:NAD(P) transhydrogenase subunit alpha [Holosporaceae bacterium]
MRISVVIEETERRVAITPGVVKKYLDLGLEVVIPRGVGLAAGFLDSEYEEAGAIFLERRRGVLDADLYVGIRPSPKDVVGLRPGAYLIAISSSLRSQTTIKKMRADGICLCALEKIPRISRAQSMDVLSSQANIAGYRAVLEALMEYKRVVPLMMTAAGTVRPAKVLVLGAGVAGLQAIATARRLGAIVYAFDVRSATKEQVESLGARFIEVENADDGEAGGGYAKEMDNDYKLRQAEKLRQIISQTDIVISTAQIPGKAAPRLITKEMVASMLPGSVIVDLAMETGGNCELSEHDKIVKIGEVSIISHMDFAARVAYDSSLLFAKNVFNFVSLMVKDGGTLDTSDEIISATMGM